MPVALVNPEARRTTRSNPSRHLLASLAILALAFTLVAANQVPLPAPGPDNPADMAFEMEAYPQKPATMCIGDKLDIYIAIFRSIHKSINGKTFDLYRGSVSGVPIKGKVAGAKIGSLTPPEMSGSWELADLTMGGANFRFTAMKKGKTTLSFDGTIGSYWDGEGNGQTAFKSYPVHAELSVTVMPCKFRGKAGGKWTLSVDGLDYSATAMMDDMEIVPDAQGNFSGSAAVTWADSWSVTGCGTTSSLGASQASLTGKMDESGQLMVDLDLGTTTWSGTLSCPVVGSFANSVGGVKVDPMSLSLSSSGGVTTVARGLGTAGQIPGSVFFAVTPEEDQAVSFDPGSQPAQIAYPLEWRGFPAFFNGLGALQP